MKTTKRLRSRSLECDTFTTEHKEMKLENSLLDLPTELIVEVFSHMGLEELIRLGSTSKYLHRVSQTSSLWIALFDRCFKERTDFNHLVPNTVLLDPISKFKVFYLEYLKTISYNFPECNDNIFQAEELNSANECLEYFSQLISDGREYFLSRRYNEAYSHFNKTLGVIATCQLKYKHLSKEEGNWELECGMDILEANILKGMCLRNMRYYTLAKSTYIASISMAKELSTRFRHSHLRVIGCVISAYQNLGVVLCLLRNYSQALSIYDHGYLLWVEFIQDAQPSESQFQEFLSFLCNRIYTLRKLHEWKEIAASVYEYTIHTSANEQDTGAVEDFIDAQLSHWDKKELKLFKEHLDQIDTNNNEHLLLIKKFLQEELSECNLVQ